MFLQDQRGRGASARLRARAAQSIGSRFYVEGDYAKFDVLLRACTSNSIGQVSVQELRQTDTGGRRPGYGRIASSGQAAFLRRICSKP